MRYLAVKNFHDYQHYRDRNPVWIKLYNRVMDDDAFLALPDAARGHLMLIWLLASRRNNKIPADAKLIAKAIQATGRVNLTALIEAGFLVPWEESASIPDGNRASSALAEPEQDAIPERERDRETEEDVAELTATGAQANAEMALRGMMGEGMAAVVRFLDTRPPRSRPNWFPELLQIIGPSTGVTPEDLAGACSDALLVDPPVTTPVALRAFAQRRKHERHRAAMEPTAPVGSPASASTNDDAAWGEAMDLVARMNRREVDATAFAALPAPLRTALKAIGGWTTIRDARASDLPFRRKDFLAAYRAALTPAREVKSA